MILIHQGIQPSYPFDHGKQHPNKKLNATYKFEPFPEGGGKWWSEKELASGCHVIFDKIKKQNGLIYCPYCDEWFTDKQFTEMENESSYRLPK